MKHTFNSERILLVMWSTAVLYDFVCSFVVNGMVNIDRSIGTNPQIFSFVLL